MVGGVSPTLCAGLGVKYWIMILDKVEKYEDKRSGRTGVKVITRAIPCATRSRHYINKNEALEIHDDGISNSLTSVAKDSLVMSEENYEYRIRKLTPMECFKLMGFSEEDYLAARLGDREKARKLMAEYEPDRHLEMMQLAESKEMTNVSSTQLYKQAGNSIVVDVLYYIYKQLYKAMPYLFDNLKVGSYFSGIGAFEAGLDRLYSEL